PIALLSPARRPSRDCVQNQTSNATAVIATRSASDFQRTVGVGTCESLARSGCPIGGAISGELIAELLYAAQIEFAGAEIGHSFDAAELIGSWLPKRRQIDFGKLA